MADQSPHGFGTGQPHLELNELLKKALNHDMTARERLEQKISWMRSEMGQTPWGRELSEEELNKRLFAVCPEFQILKELEDALKERDKWKAKAEAWERMAQDILK